MPSRDCFEATAVTRTTVSPYCTQAAPSACRATRPASMARVRPPTVVSTRAVIGGSPGVRSPGGSAPYPSPAGSRAAFPGPPQAPACPGDVRPDLRPERLGIRVAPLLAQPLQEPDGYLEPVEIPAI